MTDHFLFTCPSCRAPVEALRPDVLRCTACGEVYRCEGGIWRFLPTERQLYFQKFLAEYQAVRQAEGRGSSDPAYYRGLPFSGPAQAGWPVRAASYRALLQHVVLPLERRLGRPLRALDLGAGNGWLSYRLAQRGHRAAAVDLLDGARDGLGAHVHYDAPFLPIQAEFDCLPFADAQADLLVFNASFHYSTDYARTLREALRVLSPGGLLVVLDTPLYRDAASGRQMVQERQQRFRRLYGFPSDALPSENFLTFERLEALAGETGLRWQAIAPSYGLRWALRPLKARLRGRREPARFLLLVGERRP